MLDQRKRDPDLRTQKSRGDFKSSNRVSDPKRAERGNSSSLGRKSSLFMLLEETRQRAEGTFSIIKLSAHCVSGPHDPAISGAGEVKEEFHPRCTSIEGCHLLGPLELGPVPLYR